jgi:hypothetical protein
LSKVVVVVVEEVVVIVEVVVFEVVKVTNSTDHGVMDQPIVPKLPNVIKTITTVGAMAMTVLENMTVSHARTEHQSTKRQQLVAIQWVVP